MNFLSVMQQPSTAIDVAANSMFIGRLLPLLDAPRSFSIACIVTVIGPTKANTGSIVGAVQPLEDSSHETR